MQVSGSSSSAAGVDAAGRATGIGGARGSCYEYPTGRSMLALRSDRAEAGRRAHRRRRVARARTTRTPPATCPTTRWPRSSWRCFLRGLDRAETHALTDAMLAQRGDARPRRTSAKPRIDKHSTGGVGDKVSIVLAPLVASLGVAVPMMSGRGLGHTGGTLDKLESIPGFRTDLSLAEARAQLERIGCALIGQTGGDRARRPQDVRAARRDRHGGVDPAHRREHHEQEARGGTHGPRARREARLGRVPARARPRARARDAR